MLSGVYRVPSGAVKVIPSMDVNRAARAFMPPDETLGPGCSACSDGHESRSARMPRSEITKPFPAVAMFLVLSKAVMRR